MRIPWDCIESHYVWIKKVKGTIVDSLIYIEMNPNEDSKTWNLTMYHNISHSIVLKGTYVDSMLYGLNPQGAIKKRELIQFIQRVSSIK